MLFSLYSQMVKVDFNSRKKRKWNYGRKTVMAGLVVDRRSVFLDCIKLIKWECKINGLEISLWVHLESLHKRRGNHAL